MAFFENRFYAAGVVNGKVKYSHTVNGDEFAWFPVRIENRLGATSTESNYHQDLGIMVFNKKLIDYMKAVEMKRNDLVVVFGFLSAYKHEVKGTDVTGHGINATQVFVVKKKPTKTN